MGSQKIIACDALIRFIQGSLCQWVGKHRLCRDRPTMLHGERQRL